MSGRGSQHAVPNITSAIQDPDKTRRALVGRVLPHTLSELFGFIKFDDNYNVFLNGALSGLYPVLNQILPCKNHFDQRYKMQNEKE